MDNLFEIFVDGKLKATNAGDLETAKLLGFQLATENPDSEVRITRLGPALNPTQVPVWRFDREIQVWVEPQ